jgi:hypothetical protein
MPLPRRQFLTQASAGLAGTLLAGLVGSVPGCAPARSAVQGRLRGAGHALGHLLRTPGKIPPPSRTETADTVIIGGGVSGLAARRELHRLAPGHRTLLLELEADTGGNAAAGHNGRTAYPWGAHYRATTRPPASPFMRKRTSATTPTSACCCTATGRPA